MWRPLCRAFNPYETRAFDGPGRGRFSPPRRSPHAEDTATLLPAPPPATVPNNPEMRPLLRGVSHAVAAVVAVGETYILLHRSRSRRQKITRLVYGASTVQLFTASALYHLRAWPSRYTGIGRWFDHSSIYVLIAGSYTPMVDIVLTGRPRRLVLGAVWTIAAIGSVAASPIGPTTRAVRVALYLGVSWMGLGAAPRLLRRRPRSFVLLIVAGLLYSGGALGYAFRRPRLWPRFFGYHEVFHLAVIAANGLFFVYMLTDVVDDLPHVHSEATALPAAQ